MVESTCLYIYMCIAHIHLYIASKWLNTLDVTWLTLIKQGTKKEERRTHSQHIYLYICKCILINRCFGKPEHYLGEYKMSLILWLDYFLLSFLLYIQLKFYPICFHNVTCIFYLACCNHSPMSLTLFRKHDFIFKGWLSTMVGIHNWFCHFLY
jgi:hypothetical protein